MASAIILKVDGTSTPLGHRPTLEESQKIVGGYVELVRAKGISGEPVVLVVDEEGKPKGKPLNKYITDTYGQSIFGGIIVGDVIVLRGWETVG